MRLGRAVPALLLAAAHLVATPAGAQDVQRFGVDAGPDGAATVQSRGLLEDQGLRTALESGLPLRFRLRVELWRKALFDQLRGADEVNVALVFDPLNRVYVVDYGIRQVRHASLAAAQTALERELRPSLRPTSPGRYYYLGSLQIETLSLSDLEELRRWLRGDVQPAVQGRSSPSRAVESGLRRIFVRVIGLPSRNYEDRSATFIVR